MEPKMAEKPRTPNLVLRRIREEERQETRNEFADALAQVAARLGESVMPSERYIAHLEDGDVRYPGPAYRRVLIELCGRPITDLGYPSRYPAIPEAVLGDDESSLIRPVGVSSGVLAVHGALDSVPAWAAAGTGDIAESSEWPLWFGVKLAQLIALVDDWHEPTVQFDSLQDLLHQEILMFDATRPESQRSADAFHVISRRNTLITLAALPLALRRLGTESAGVTGSSSATDYFLSRCAASLTACWHLLRGSDLPTVSQMLGSYMVALESAARQRSRYQQAAARLASQAHRICGIIALHRDQLRMREYHCKQALHYAAIASDVSSQASALISLASTYYYSSSPDRAAEVYEEALGLGSQMPPLQKSRVHAELSVVYGQLRREQDAIRSAGLSEDLYPDDPENDRSFLYAEFTPASLTLENGLAYTALAEQYPGRRYQDKAEEIFSRLDGTTSAVPDRIRLEIINHQARTAVLRNDLDSFEIFIRRAVNGFTMLDSRQRQRELETAWQYALEAWPDEPRLRALGQGVHSAGSLATRENAT
jgi:tetratricopeptide (TPR) repeat protein